MKRTLFLLIFTFVTFNLSFPQNRSVTRGATSGELYLAGAWYGIYSSLCPPFYESLRTAVYRLIENGKKISIQYDVDYFIDYYTEPGSIMQPGYILADATTGIIYSIHTYSKNSYSHIQLWISYDFGNNWLMREENIPSVSGGYLAGANKGIIYKGVNGFFRSIDYGLSFINIPIPKKAMSELGLLDCEGFSVGKQGVYGEYNISHTFDCGQTVNSILIDPQFVFGQICGIFPDVYRGGLPGEVYISSLFPDGSYKVSFSADTGHTFRHVYVANEVDCTKGGVPIFMSDREPGVFYIVKGYEIEDFNPWGWHTKICVEYYRDYGETLEATFCHDITKNYEYEEVICENTTHLEANVTQNTVYLQWTNLVDTSFIRGYHVYRNNERITNELLKEPSFVDKISYSGEYEYFVRTYYKEGCVSDSSNHVTERVELGVKPITNYELRITLYPNPTNGELRIENGELRIMSVEIFDVYGRKILVPSLTVLRSYDLTVLHPGIYFVKITTEQGVVVKKVVKL